MNKLLDAYREFPASAVRRKNLANYLRRHPMAVCFASVEDIAFLRDHGFI